MQKLSAWKYIKNNKRRVSVLIVSLGLCFVLVYLTEFLLSSTEETMRPILLENTKKIQYISLAESSLGMRDEELGDENIYMEKNLEVAGELKMQKGIEQVWYSSVIYEVIRPAIGNMTVEIPLVEKESIPDILNHFGTKAVEGRLPENPGEIVLDKASMKNNGFELGGYFNEENYEEVFKIVGVLDCDNYFGCGIPDEEYEYQNMLIVLSDGSIKDIAEVCHNVGIDVRENYDTIVDYKWGEQFLRDEITDVIGNSTTYVYIGILILLSVSLIIVYAMYLGDRHNEWCLYCSIGYSRKAIYFSILRELLFTFAAAFIIGSVIICGSVVVLDYAMIKPLGIRCRYFYPKCIGEILCSYMLILGILQIPVRYALYKIQTIDAMDDDLY